MVKKILSIVLWVITGAALIVLFVFGRRHFLETPLQGIDFQLERSHAKGFVDTDSVMSYVETVTDIEHKARISRIDVMKIRKWIDRNPWVERSWAYIGLNDTLIIRAQEYEPMLRVFNQEHRSVYLTEEGVVIPSSPIYTPRTIVASGSFRFPILYQRSDMSDSIYAGSGVAEALAIAKALRKDEFLAGNIGQIYKNSQNEYELMVNNLTARVILGDTCLVDNKLQKLKKLLESYSGTTELEGYKTLSLKYKNQIVCTK